MATNESSQSANQSQPPGSTNQVGQMALPLLILLGLLLYLPGLGSYGPLDPTDSFFIEGARELNETKQYLLPMFNYQVWLDKPILYFWLVAGCYKIFGVSAFVGRLVSALSAVLTGVAIFLGARPALGYKQAFTAALIFLTFPLVSVIGHESLTDMTLTLLMSGSLLGFFNYLRRPSTVTIVVAYLCLALAFLCKGPVAVVIVGLIVLLQLAATTEFSSPTDLIKVLWARVMALRPWLGLLIMLVVNLPWYGAATYYTHGAFFQAFFITQNFGRMVGKVNHLEPFWYYIPVIIGGLFPLNLALFACPSLLVAAVKKRKLLSREEGFIFFSLLWAAFVLLLFGLLKTKLATYILPAMPPLAILTAAVIFYLIERGRVKHLWPGAVFFVLAGAGGLAAAALIKASWVKVLLQEQQLLLILTVVAGFLYLFCLLKNQARAAFATLLLSAAIGVGVAVPHGHRVFYREVHKPFEAMIMRVIKDRAQIATVVTEEPSISYFLHRHIDVINTPVEAERYLAQKGEFAGSKHYLLVPEKCLRDMEWFPPNARQLAKIRKWTLFCID
ncbi:MAG: glycosyltransferase family 39 protein [Cyanobacteria bacterium SZAS TMP-1]|nr:glycosyltransferase family 39 protein [Cyanobacteria bacterium SZAS TMP-1]